MNQINTLAKKYDLTERDFDCIYYNTLSTVRKISGKVNEDLFVKYMYDKLEEQGITYRDTEKIVEYYRTELELYHSKKEQKTIQKIMDGEDAISVVEEEMQTSSNTGIDGDIGMNRKHGYTTKVIDMYEDEEDLPEED